MGLAEFGELERFDPQSVAVVFMSRYQGWYPGDVVSIADIDKIRGDIALQTFRLASTLGYKVVVGDSDQSSAEFRQNLHLIENVVLAPRITDDFVLGVLSGLQTASHIDGVKAIITTQPEKDSLIRDCIPQLVRPIIFEGADVVVAKREEELFKDSFPAYMRESEEIGNRILNRLLRGYGLLKPYQPDLDFFSGSWAYRNDPDLLREIIAVYEVRKKSEDERTVRRYIGKHGFYYIFDALRLGRKVVSAEVPLVYSQEQKLNEEDSARIDEFRQKRRGQRYAILEELIEYIRLNCEGTRRRSVLERSDLGFR